jgi:hypothetical protein
VRATGWQPRLALLLLSAAATAVAGSGLRRERRAVTIDLAVERDLHGAPHLGSVGCRRCHEDHYRSWHRTFHRTMTQPVSARDASAVLGDFNGAVQRYGGVEARMDRDAAGSFRMTFTAIRAGGGARASGPSVTAIISRAVGSRRYQQYLTRIGDAEYRLPVAYHIEERRWFHMNGAFLTPDPPQPPAAAWPAAGGAANPLGLPADYARHVTRWNDNCVFCHNVAPNPGRDPSSGAFRTEVAEMGVACEACHGPGGEHARANRDPLRRYFLRLGGQADPTIVNPSRLSPARSADVCGRCHGQRITDDVGRFLQHGDPFVPGDDLGLYSAPLWQETTLAGQRGVFAARFWADGTARLTAYEYQGLLQSPCAQRGALTCTSCHGMHDGDPRGQLRPAAAAGAGDGACTGCHPALAADAAKARHAHHDAAGPGVRCVACHMPRMVYGVLDIHRSHRIEVPDPARAASFGRPDACTGCHVDQTAAWAAAAIARLWGRPPAGDASPAAGAAGPLAAILSGDPIERAVAADALGRAAAPAGAPALAARRGLLLDVMINDDYPAVRHLAWRALGRLSDGQAARPLRAIDYDPTGPAGERRRAGEAVRAALPPAALSAPEAAVSARLRAQARMAAIEIGE